MKLRIWWIPQIPMTPFYRDVPTVEEAARLLDTLAEYDKFQYENRVKPDYCNTGGLQMFDTEDDTDGPKGSWSDWWSEEAMTDDINEYLEWKREQSTTD